MKNRKINTKSQKTFLTPDGWQTYFIYDILFWEILAYYLLVVAISILKPSIDRSNYVQLTTKEDLEETQVVSTKNVRSKGLKKLIMETEQNATGIENRKPEKDKENGNTSGSEGFSDSNDSERKKCGPTENGKKSGNNKSDEESEESKGLLENAAIDEWVKKKKEQAKNEKNDG